MGGRGRPGESGPAANSTQRENALVIVNSTRSTVRQGRLAEHPWRVSSGTLPPAAEMVMFGEFP